MKTTKRIAINTNSDKVWDIFAHDYDNAHKWMASIPNSFGIDGGKKFKGATSSGRVCELDGNPKGLKAKETFLAYDEANKSYTLLVQFLNTPFGFPIVKNEAEFFIEDNEDNLSIMTFTATSTLKPLGFILYPLIKLGFSFLLKQVLEELKFYVENGKPHPRKIKAMGKMKQAITE